MIVSFEKIATATKMPLFFTHRNNVYIYLSLWIWILIITDKTVYFSAFCVVGV